MMMKRHSLKHILNHKHSKITLNINEATLSTSPMNQIFIELILYFGFKTLAHIPGCLILISIFLLIGIKIWRCLKIPIMFSFFKNSSLVFCKKKLKYSEIQYKLSRDLFFQFHDLPIPKIVFSLIGVKVICSFQKLYDPTKYASNIKSLSQLENNTPITPLLIQLKCLVYLGCINESINQGRSYVDKNINISDCSFSRLSAFAGDGGVISVYGVSCTMIINFSMFYNCVCSNLGGAIYFDSSNSSLRMICANRCSAYSWYHFADLVSSQLNLVEYLSVSCCSPSTSAGYPICLNTGYQRVDNTNSSMNNVKYHSGIGIFSPSSFTSSHCTFSNNKASDWICINFYSTSGTISMSYSNIIHNNSPIGNGVVYVWGSGSRKMMYCIFQNNQNYLCSVPSGTLEVSHSFIDHSSSFCYTESVSSETNNSFINRLTFQIQFFHSHYCKADNPLIDTTPVTTFDVSPIKSLKETIRKTIENTFMSTPQWTLHVTPHITPIQSPIRSATQMSTPQLTLHITPQKTPYKSIPYEHPHLTPFQTLENSPFEETLRMSNERTIDQSIRETPKNTIYRSYDVFQCTNQINNMREIASIFIFLYPVIILMIS